MGTDPIIFPTVAATRRTVMELANERSGSRLKDSIRRLRKYHAGPGEVLQLKWHEVYQSDGTGTGSVQK